MWHGTRVKIVQKMHGELESDINTINISLYLLYQYISTLTIVCFATCIIFST